VAQEEPVEAHPIPIQQLTLAPTQMDLQAQVPVLIMATEVQLLQGAEQVEEEAIILEVLALEVEFHQVVMAATEARVVVVAVVQQRVEQMALPVVMDQLEQAEQAFHSRFLATMEEILKHTVQVEMAEQILPHSLISQLEQADPLILVREVEEVVPLLFRHPAAVASSKWVEMAGPVWSLFNILRKYNHMSC
jgi:hypothetical protein